MADGTKIEWTDATWNPITGCSVVSPGCASCYAMRMAGTRFKNHPSRRGLTTQTRAGPVWNGEVYFNRNWLDQPLRWRKPRMIFVCAHGDLFAENVPDEWIDRVFAVMALAPKHIFQMLTKRAERMCQYLADLQAVEDRIADIWLGWRDDPSWPAFSSTQFVACGRDRTDRIWPLSNVWCGVSVEDQTRADERIPLLLDTPAAVRWISAEPLLGAVDLTDIATFRFARAERINALTGVGKDFLREPTGQLPARLDWVVAGGESGPNARPMNPAWARSLRDQCADSDVPFLLKQNGEFVSVSEMEGPGEIHRFPTGEHVIRVGKKQAGRTLDGVTHDAFPRAAT